MSGATLQVAQTDVFSITNQSWLWLDGQNARDDLFRLVLEPLLPWWRTFSAIGGWFWGFGPTAHSTQHTAKQVPTFLLSPINQPKWMEGNNGRNVSSCQSVSHRKRPEDGAQTAERRKKDDCRRWGWNGRTRGSVWSVWTFGVDSRNTKCGRNMSIRISQKVSCKRVTAWKYKYE